MTHESLKPETTSPVDAESENKSAFLDSLEKESMEKLDWFIDGENDAREFISDLTGFAPHPKQGEGPSLPPLFIMEYDRTTAMGSHSAGNYMFPEHWIRMQKSFIPDVPTSPAETEHFEFQRRKVLMTTVHELAHGTIEDATNNANLSIAGGPFFEEAWADQVTRRYLSAKGMSSDELLPSPPIDGSSLLIDGRYVLRSGKQASAGQSMFAAYGIDMLEECRQELGIGERSLFEIMLATRSSEARAEAIQEFISVVETIEPGLFQTLSHQYRHQEQFFNAARFIETIHQQKAPRAHQAKLDKIQ